MIDWSKPLRTVEGHYPCRVYRTDLKGDYPILITIDYGDWEETDKLNLDGRVHLDNKFSYIENIPEEKFVWINVYEHHNGELFINLSFKNKQDAEEFQSDIKNRVGCLKVKLERRFDE